MEVEGSDPVKFRLYAAMELILAGIGRRLTLEENQEIKEKYGKWITTEQIECEVKRLLESDRRQLGDLDSDNAAFLPS